MRKKIVAGNWKMNKNYEDGISLTSEIINMVKDEVRSEVKVILIPPFIHLHAVSSLSSGNSKVSTGAQNCHQENSGAFTGEVSADMIKSTGAAYIIIGHSERRQYFNENNQLLAKKTDSVLKSGLTPIFCCGETLDERNSGSHFDIISSQVSEALFHLSEADIQKLVIAYEPVWAIGTGVTASKDQAQEMHARIRKLLTDKYGSAVAEEISILYGGSVKADNASELFSQKDIDGGLVGGASLSSRGFTDIIKAMQ